MGTWMGSDIWRTSSLNCTTLLDNPPSQLPFNSFLSKLIEALLIWERGVVCCFQPHKCPPPSIFSLKSWPLAGWDHWSWPFTTVLPPRTSEKHPHSAQLADPPSLTCFLWVLRITFFPLSDGVQDNKSLSLRNKINCVSVSGEACQVH